MVYGDLPGLILLAVGLQLSGQIPQTCATGLTSWCLPWPSQRCIRSL